MSKIDNKKSFNLKGIANTFKNTFDREEDIYEEDEVSEVQYDSTYTEISAKPSSKINKSPDKILHIFKPRNREEDVAEIILQLRDGSPCVVNVSELPEEEAKRIIDNISGAAFALMGSGVPITKGIYAFTPKTFAVKDSNVSEQPKQDILLTKNN